MIAYMPQWMLAGWTKFIPVGKYIIRIHFKRIWIGDYRKLPFGLFRFDIKTQAYYDNLADKYIPKEPVPLTKEDIEWAQKLIKENHW